MLHRKFTSDRLFFLFFTSDGQHTQLPTGTALKMQRDRPTFLPNTRTRLDSVFNLSVLPSFGFVWLRWFVMQPFCWIRVHSSGPFLVTGGGTSYNGLCFYFFEEMPSAGDAGVLWAAHRWHLPSFGGDVLCYILA